MAVACKVDISLIRFEFLGVRFEGPRRGFPIMGKASLLWDLSRWERVGSMRTKQKPPARPPRVWTTDLGGCADFFSSGWGLFARFARGCAGPSSRAGPAFRVIPALSTGWAGPSGRPGVGFPGRRRSLSARCGSAFGAARRPCAPLDLLSSGRAGGFCLVLTQCPRHARLRPRSFRLVLNCSGTRAQASADLRR